MEELQREIERLKAQLEAERLTREKLEEECDLLAEDNERLRSMAPAAAAAVAPAVTLSSSTTNASALPVGGMSGGSNSSTSIELDVFVEGENDYAFRLHKSITNASNGKNVLSTAIFVSNPSLEFGDLVFCGGVDAMLRAYDLTTGVELLKEVQTAPVLSIDCSATHVACGNMDGSHMLIVMESMSGEKNPVIQRFKDHSKYVIAVKWSADGQFLATAGHDKQVNIYRKNDFGEMIKYKSLNFNFTPESIAFYTLFPDTSTSTSTSTASASFATAAGASAATEEHALVSLAQVELIIGLRGVPYLIYCNVDTMEQRSISVNENEWDTHVSFVPLYLSISPDQRYLLIATDKNMHIVLRIGSNRRVRTLTGHICGDYGKPYAVWDSTGKYVYCNSEEEHVLYVYSLASQRVVEKLKGHSGIIRALAVHPRKNLVTTASYDKSVGIWTNVPEGSR